MSNKYKTEFSYLAPILASLMFGTLCASLIKSASVEPYPVTPFPEETFGSLGSFGNAFYFVILVGIGATLLYLLLRRRSLRLIAVLTGFALTTAVFVLCIIYLFAGFSGFDIPYADALTILLAIAITSVTDYAIFRNKRKLTSMAVLSIGGALGAFLGFSIPTESTVLILGFLAVYDTFAVYRGPVGKIAHVGLDQLRGLSFSFKDIQMGLGDLTFYSMLSGHMLLSYGLASCLASIGGILAGCIVSFKMLERKGMFPGLPFPVAFGLTAGFMALLV